MNGIVATQGHTVILDLLNSWGTARYGAQISKNASYSNNIKLKFGVQAGLHHSRWVLGQLLRPSL